MYVHFFVFIISSIGFLTPNPNRWHTSFDRAPNLIFFFLARTKTFVVCVCLDNIWRFLSPKTCYSICIFIACVYWNLIPSLPLQLLTHTVILLVFVLHDGPHYTVVDPNFVIVKGYWCISAWNCPLLLFITSFRLHGIGLPCTTFKFVSEC